MRRGETVWPIRFAPTCYIDDGSLLPYPAPHSLHVPDSLPCRLYPHDRQRPCLAQRLRCRDLRPIGRSIPNNSTTNHHIGMLHGFFVVPIMGNQSDEMVGIVEKPGYRSKTNAARALSSGTKPIIPTAAQQVKYGWEKQISHHWLKTQSANNTIMNALIVIFKRLIVSAPILLRIRCTCPIRYLVDYTRTTGSGLVWPSACVVVIYGPLATMVGAGWQG